MKKFLLIALVLNANSFAIESSQPVNGNKSTVGGRQQGSSQQFGEPVISGVNGQKASHGVVKHPNDPTVGGRQQGSNQQFGEPVISGVKGQRASHGVIKHPNNPTVGGRQQGSNQIFGNP